MARYLKTVGPPTAKIMFIGEAPGEQEDRYGIPFYNHAPTGKLFNNILEVAGIVRQDVLIANVARELPPGGNIDFYYLDTKRNEPKPILKKWIAELKREIETFRPNIIVTLGAVALKVLTGKSSITESRGYICESTLVPGQKVLPTYHPSFINRGMYKHHFTLVLDFIKAKKNSKDSDIPFDRRKIHAAPSKREFCDYLDFLYNDFDGPIGADIETTRAGTYTDTIGLAHSPNEAFSFQFFHGNGKSLYSPLTEREIWHKLALVLTHKPTVFQNGSFDISSLYLHNRILCKNIYADTHIAAHVVWPELPRSLGFLASVCLNVPEWKNLAAKMPNFYNGCDAANTLGIWFVLEDQINKLEAWDTFRWEMKQILPAVRLQLRGIDIDIEKRTKVLAQLNTDIEQKEIELRQTTGQNINFNSSDQLKKLLYIDLGLPVQYKRRKRISDPQVPSVNKEALKTLQSKTDNPIFKEIIKYKELRHLRSSLDIKVSPQNRVHSSYNITGTAMAKFERGTLFEGDGEKTLSSFGRWSSSGSILLPYGTGNLQNVTHKARTVYTAGPGKVFVQADYKQAEAVVVAFITGDPVLKAMFTDAFGLSPSECTERGYDIHKITAVMMFNVMFADVTKGQRVIGKRLRHASNYSAGPKVVAVNIGCSLQAAKHYIQVFHQKNPQLTAWHTQIRHGLERSRFITNLLGRKHKFLERWGDELFRAAYAFGPQSTVGDLLNHALVKADEAELDIALQLHDAIYTRCENNEDDIIQNIETLRRCMIAEVQPLTAPDGTEFFIDVDFKVGPYWGGMTELNVKFDSNGKVIHL